VIAGILNRQGRTTAYGHRFTAGRVGNCVAMGYPMLRADRRRGPRANYLTIKKAAVVLGVAPSTIHRLLNDASLPASN